MFALSSRIRIRIIVTFANGGRLYQFWEVEIDVGNGCEYVTRMVGSAFFAIDDTQYILDMVQPD